MQDAPRIQTLSSLAGRASWRLKLHHSRETHLLVWITRGQGVATVNGQRHGLGVHSALFIPAGTLFSLSMGAQGFGTVLVAPPSAQIALPGLEQLLRIRDVRRQTELTGLIEAMQREQAAPRDFHPEAARAHATLVAIWLRRAILDAPAPERPGADARLAAAFASLVARDYRTGRPMASYAEKLGVTPTHLSRCCKSAAGISASAILTERALHAARTLLADTSHPVGRISSHLGFGSPAYFSRFIQTQTGCPPSQLRSENRAAPQY